MIDFLYLDISTSKSYIIKVIQMIGTFQEKDSKPQIPKPLQIESSIDKKNPINHNVLL